ncbi:endolytic transglycosylase MltG [Nonomuraea sp. K274]|uniref:Endolytic murein transglycosylase n=1 Tax=Nonomuraea cypriaca TaxID=1187855 RepID=A0A931A5K4_9ACTN|nr:endolytic transglycosylase MltG [Nonomuraea cypriaca]MBF8185154.1 endolytic transglycosylase MltG [Nonomuraea cypriaca]
MSRPSEDEDDVGDVIPFGAADDAPDPASESPGTAHSASERAAPGEPEGEPAGESEAEPVDGEPAAAGELGAEPVDGRAEVVPVPARRAVRKAALLTGGLAISLLALGAGVFAVLRPYISPEDYEGTGSGAVTVRIAPGSSAEAIGFTLADAGVVASARSFVRATEDRAVADRLRPGHYRLRKGMAAAAALDLLLKPASKVVRRVTVPEGMRVSEVLARLAMQAALPLKELQNVDKALVGLPDYARGLEGFLFPATYEIEPGDTAVDVLAAMVERFGAAARQMDLKEQAARVRLTPLEAVTVASMIQAEGGTDGDYPKIARVIYNRLQRGTPLEIDSTVLYAQNRRTLRVTESDTKVDSPYNTYRHKGLPPGPIANPGEKALMAALNPAEGDWHWFVTTDPAHRITKFTNKESEFVRYREELNKNLGTS